MRRRGLRTAAVSLAAFAAVTVPAGAQIGHDIRDPDGFTHSFKSESWIHPPIASITGKDPDPNASGDVFVNVGNSIQSGPMILDPDGNLIWFDPLPNRGAAFDTAVQTYDGQTALTFYAAGADVIMNHNYQTIATVNAGNGYALDLHEFELTPQGTALITVAKDVPWNLSAVGGPRQGMLSDSAIQEIDVKTGQVLWQWDSDQHVPITASYAPKPHKKKPWDYFHINSVQQLPDGNLLVSARQTWTVYEIDKQTGAVLWRLGGKNSSFKIGHGANFEWQHDATMMPDGHTMTLFDDGAGAYDNESQSRALRINLNYQRHRATLVHAYTHNPPLLTYSQGNLQTLPDGNTFVGFGSAPFFTEYGRGGAQLFTIRFDRPVQTYRAYRFQWWGQPATPPSIAVSTTPHGTRVYASWNGATDVASWRVLAGPSPTQLSAAGEFHKTFFETQMWVGSTKPYFAAQALDQHGNVLATSSSVGR